MCSITVIFYLRATMYYTSYYIVRKNIMYVYITRAHALYFILACTRNVYTWSMPNYIITRASSEPAISERNGIFAYFFPQTLHSRRRTVRAGLCSHYSRVPFVLSVPHAVTFFFLQNSNVVSRTISPLFS